MTDEQVVQLVLAVVGVKAYLWVMDRWVWPRILCDYCGSFQVRRRHAHEV